MTSSGTATFNPSIGEFVLYAYGLCGVRRTALTQEHMADARMAMNVMLGDWDNDTPNLWRVSLVENALTQGIATYDFDASTVMILDAYIRVTDSSGNPIDRIIWPLSRTEYASMPNKTQQGEVTSFWFDRLLNPTVTLWQVPDGNGPYTLRSYVVTQIFDANLPNGETVDLPKRWFSAFAYGLAERLAYSYAPERVPILAPKAKELMMQAMEQDVENVALSIQPTLSGYYG